MARRDRSPRARSWAFKMVKTVEDVRKVLLEQRLYCSYYVLTGQGNGAGHLRSKPKKVYIYVQTYMSDIYTVIGFHLSITCLLILKGRVHFFFIRELDVPPLGESKFYFDGFFRTHQV